VAVDVRNNALSATSTDMTSPACFIAARPNPSQPPRERCCNDGWWRGIEVSARGIGRHARRQPIGVVTSGTGHLDAQYRRITNTTMIALRGQVRNVIIRQNSNIALFMKDYFCFFEIKVGLATSDF
jgi:hypothetical protein